jgi:hypothetical protein
MNLYEGLVNRQAGAVGDEPVARLPFCSEKKLLLLGIEKVQRPDPFPVERYCFSKQTPRLYGVALKTSVKILPA